MQLSYQISPYPLLLEDLVARIYEVASPNSEIDSIIIPEKNGSGVPTPGAGHQVINTITFTGLDTVVHRVKLFSASGTQFHEYDAMPTVDVTTIFTPIKFTIGDGGAKTPASGDISYVDSDMIGLTDDDFTVYCNGRGYLFPGVDYDNDGSTTGGFTFLGVGDIFGAGGVAEKWVIQRKPQVVSTPVNDSVVGKQFKGFLDVTSSVTYDPAHLRKCIRLAGASAEYVFGPSVVPPQNYVFRVTNFGSYASLATFPKVKFQNASLKWGNTTKTELPIPLLSTMEFCFDGTQWNVTKGDYRAVNPGGLFPKFYQGSAAVGDVSGDAIITVTIPDQGYSSYHVSGTLTSAGSASFDNDVIWVVKDKTNTSFKLCLGETTGAVNNVNFEYVIINFN